MLGGGYGSPTPKGNTKTNFQVTRMERSGIRGSSFMRRNSLRLLCPAPAEYPRSKSSELEAGGSNQIFTFVAIH
jgi:hypothetical protein